MATVPLKRLVDPTRPITYGIVQAGEDVVDGIRYIRPVDMDGHRGVHPSALRTTSPEIAAAYARSSLKPGDVVVSIGPSFGKTMIVPEDLDGANLTQGTARVAVRPDVHARYIVWALQSQTSVDFWETSIGGATFRALNLGPLAETPIPMPSLQEQRAIADYLDRETARIDTLIAEQQSLIEMLRERRASEIAAGFAGAATTPLRQVIEYAQTGPFGTQLTADEYIESGVPVINPTHIRRGLIVPDDSTTVTPEKAEDLERYRLAVGDIVLGRKGEVDKSALVDRRSAGYVCGSDTMGLRPSPGTVPDYLWWFLQSAEAHSQLEFWSVGATVSGLNQTTIRRVRLPLPNEQEQLRVASYLYEKTAKIDALIAETELFIELARERRAALITAAVTDQIDVREVA